jgi:hypothetical protein
MLRAHLIDDECTVDGVAVTFAYTQCGLTKLFMENDEILEFDQNDMVDNVEVNR